MLTNDEVNKIMSEVSDVFIKHRLNLSEGIAVLLIMAADASDTVYQTHPEVYSVVMKLWESTMAEIPVVPHDRNKGAGVA